MFIRGPWSAHLNLYLQEKIMAFVLVPSTLIFLSSSLLLSAANAQENTVKPQSTSPHGLAFENPMSFPPSTYEFFHPTTDAPATAPLPVSSFYPGKTSSRARADAAVVASVFSAPPSRGVVAGAGGIAAVVVLGLVFVMLVAMAASYMITTMIKRRANIKKKANAAVKADDA